MTAYIIQLGLDDLAVLDGDMLDDKLGCAEQFTALFAPVLARLLLLDQGRCEPLGLAANVSLAPFARLSTRPRLTHQDRDLRIR